MLTAFFKKNIETKDGCNFDKIIKVCENFTWLANTCIK